MSNILKPEDNRVLIIGEIAQAHDGSLGAAHAYIDAIADAGADVVKFQTHIAAAESTRQEPVCREPRKVKGGGGAAGEHGPGACGRKHVQPRRQAPLSAGNEGALQRVKPGWYRVKNAPASPAMRGRCFFPARQEKERGTWKKRKPTTSPRPSITPRGT